MRAKLNERTVEASRPRERMYAVRDTELKGFMLRVYPNGRKTWLYDYRNDAGRRLSYKLGNYPGLKSEGARKEAEKAAGKVAGHIDVQAEKQAARAEAERAKV